MSGYLLDTHVLLWAAQERTEKLTLLTVDEKVLAYGDGIENA